MLIPHTIMKNIIVGFISPHGMTDYIHAKKYGYLTQLYQININTMAAGGLCHFIHADSIVHGAFLISSVIHFRNDMPLIYYKNINGKQMQLLMSTMLVTTMHNFPPEYFLLYLSCIHTPNHYRLAWDYIKDNLKETLLLVLGTGFLLTQINYSGTLEMNSLDPLLITLVQTLVISHIIYQERFVFAEFTKLF